MAIGLYYGNEPYRLMRKKEEIKAVENPEMNLYITEIFGQEAYEFAYQLPFLSKERTVLVEMESCSGAELLTAYLQDPAGSTSLYVFVKQMDARSALAKAFPKKNIFEMKRYTEQELDEQIYAYVRQYNRMMSKEVCAEFKARMQYGSDEDVSFFDIRNELAKICAASDEMIDRKTVEALVPMNEKENIFALLQMILNRKSAQLFHEAQLILENRKTNVIQVLSLLLRSYRISLKASLLGRNREKEIGVHPKAIVHLPQEVSRASMQCIQEIISGIKMGRYKEAEGLLLCLSNLMEYAGDASKST